MTDYVLERDGYAPLDGEMGEYDGPVACDDCGELFPASALYGDGLCADCGAAADLAWAQAHAAPETDRFTERDESPLVKPQPKGVKAGPMDI